MFDEFIRALEVLQAKAAAAEPQGEGQWSDLIELAERMFVAAGAR